MRSLRPLRPICARCLCSSGTLFILMSAMYPVVTKHVLKLFNCKADSKLGLVLPTLSPVTLQCEIDDQALSTGAHRRAGHPLRHRERNNGRARAVHRSSAVRAIVGSSAISSANGARAALGLHFQRIERVEGERGAGAGCETAWRTTFPSARSRSSSRSCAPRPFLPTDSRLRGWEWHGLSRRCHGSYVVGYPFATFWKIRRILTSSEDRDLCMSEDRKQRWRHFMTAVRACSLTQP